MLFSSRSVSERKAAMTESPDPNETTELPVADPEAELPAPHEAPERISLAVRLAVLIVITAPLLGVIAAPFMVWGWGFRWTDLGLLLSLYVLTALGITVGYHRLFVHRSFETNIVVKFVFAVLGSMAVQGRSWCGSPSTDATISTPTRPATPIRPTAMARASSASCEASGTPISAGCSIPTRQSWNATSRT
jgi:hypothetical protein